MLVGRLRAASAGPGVRHDAHRSAGRDRPARSGADRARRHRGADHLDPQPRHGGRAGAAGRRCPARWWRCTMPCRCSRPRWGYGSDVGGRAHALDHRRHGGAGARRRAGAAVATAWMATQPAAGIALAVLAFLLIGIGVGAAGTSLLVLLAKRGRAERRRGAAATIVWLMMIAGFAVTAGVAGHFLDPFSPATACVAVTGAVCDRGCPADAARRLAASRARSRRAAAPAPAQGRKPPFRDGARRRSGPNRQARRFTIFVFVSMLAYSAQDLILEPFAGLVFGLTPGAVDQARPACSMAACCVGMVAAWRSSAHLRRRARSARCAAGPSAAASPRRWRWSASPSPASSARPGRCARRCSRSASPTAPSRWRPSAR